ncbi:MAG: protein BatD [Candidatus Omnitrophica bacterium]|nr:protein BatD [Candidatus Omnitrophota bacterium]
MKKIFLFSMFLVFVFLKAALAQTEIKAEVDKNSLTTDEVLTYKVVVTSSEKELPAPDFPEFRGFEVVSQARSSTVSFVKAGAKSILVYAFILLPIDKGRIEIPPSSIKVKGEEYLSPSFEIEVMPQLPDQANQPRVNL